MTTAEEDAVEAAVRAVRAGDRAPHGRGRCEGPTPVEALEARLGPLDWHSFGGRGYALLRAVHARLSDADAPQGGSPDGDGGGRYEDSMSAARDRLSRALTAA